MRNIIAAILIMLLGMTTSAMADELPVMLIVSADNPINEISRSELKRIFLGKTRKWSHGEHVFITINANESALEKFCRTIVQKTPRQFSMYWRKQLYSGHSMLPTQCEDDEQVLDYVAKHSGAIGFIFTRITDSRIKEMMIAP